jgi:hypothetical protein
VTAQLALELDPTDRLDIEHAAAVLAAEAASEGAAVGRRPAPCRCLNGYGWQDENGELRCAKCGREAPA